MDHHGRIIQEHKQNHQHNSIPSRTNHLHRSRQPRQDNTRRICIPITNNSHDSRLHSRTDNRKHPCRTCRTNSGGEL